MTEPETTKDFFISYNKADRAWAEWIAWQLEAEGYSVVLQAWDFRPGGNFVLQMQEATTAKRTIAVLSPNYRDLKAVFSHAEWAAAFVQDPEGTKGKLLPIRVRECQPTGLLASISYIDFVERTASDARDLLRAGVRQSRALPSVEPLFPGNAPPPSTLAPAPSFPGEWPLAWTVPYTRNQFFTGRDDLLNRLQTQLATNKPTALNQASAISGLGGIGKTQTALEYAHRFGHEYQYILWVSAVSADSLLSGFVTLAALLNVPGQDAQDSQKTAEAVKVWLAQQRNWLLILDNADELDIAAQYFPQSNKLQGQILLTTRASKGGALVQILEVEKMGKTEGVELLLHRARLLTDDTPLEKVSSQDRADAEAIVTTLDGLPLALDQAGAYIEENDISLSNYLKLYQTRRKYLLSKRGQFSPGHPATVATTWSLSFQQVEQANPAAAELLRFCAFLAPDVIPEDILTEGASALGKVLKPVAQDPVQLNEAIQVLRSYSLLRRNRETKTLSIHRLVQVTLQDTLPPKVQRSWAERVVRTLNEVFPSVNLGTWRQAQPYVAHAEVCQSFIEHYNLVFAEAGRILYKCGVYSFYAGKYQQAELFYQRALYIYEQVFGSEHFNTANVLHALANIYQVQGKDEQTELFYQRALHILEQVFGSEHPNIGTTLHDLAVLYRNQGKFERAQLLFQRALHISEQALGPEHPDTAVTLNQLAWLYQDQGKDEQAELLYQRALHIDEQVLGPEHPDTSTCLNNLASLYREQGTDEQAELLLLRSLQIKEHALNPEHPETAITLQQLALLYRGQGKYEQSEPLFQRALSIDEQTYGLDHPKVATDLESYAALLYKIERTDEARAMAARAKKIREKQSS